MPGTVCAYLTTPTSHAYSRRCRRVSLARDPVHDGRIRLVRLVASSKGRLRPLHPIHLVNLTARSMTCLNPSLLPCCVRISAAGAFIASRTAASSTWSQSELSRAEEYAGELGVDAESLLLNGASLPLYRAFQLDGLVEGARRDHAFYEYVQSIERAGEVRSEDARRFQRLSALPTRSRADLAQHHCGQGLGGILADEMGGKDHPADCLHACPSRPITWVRPLPHRLPGIGRLQLGCRVRALRACRARHARRGKQGGTRGDARVDDRWRGR